MGEIKFKFSNDKQRNLNMGKSVNPIEANIRTQGRHFKHVRLNLTKYELRRFRLPEGIDYATYMLKDVHGYIITPKDPRYGKIKPINVSFFCSENHPFPLSRFTLQDLDAFVTNTFSRWLLKDNITEKEEAGIKDLLFTHSGLLEESDVTGNKHAVKNAFNVRPVYVKEHDLELVNKKLEILGHKIKPSEALMTTEKTINKPKRYYFEGGDF